MTPKKKYQFIIAGMLAFFLYIFAAEIIDRWQQTWGFYQDWESKVEVTPDTNTLQQQKINYQTRLVLLKEQLGQNSSEKIDQFMFLKSLHATAKESGVRIQALSPSVIQSKYTVASMALKVDVIARFHDLGHFVNILETGRIPLAVTKLEMTAGQASNSMLEASLEGNVLLPVEKAR